MTPTDISQHARTHTITLTPSIEPLSGHLNLGGTNVQGRQIEFNSYYMLREGVPCIPVMGEFHYSRYSETCWEDALLKMKAGGITIVATYIFWIHIEEDEGVFDWSGNKNLRHFIELCAKHNLDVIIRIGPFDHGECRNGGFPDWIYGRPFEVRSTDERFMAYTHRLYSQIATQVNGLLFKDGGPIIGMQLDNEYMHCGAPWEVTFKQGTEWVPSGSEGVAYLIKLKQIAQDVGLEVPIYTGTGWLNSPIIDGEMLPMQGGYAFTPWSPDPNYRQSPTREFLFSNRHLAPVLNGQATYDASRYPLVCCEIGGGIQITYYHRPIVPPQAVEAHSLMNLGSGANLIGYYMYHGGSNPIGKHSYLNEFTVPRISYDFQAPIGEFGQIQESYRSLRLLHLFLADFGDLLAPMSVTVPENAATITPENTTDLRWSVRANENGGFIFLNNYQDHVEMQDLPNLRFQIQMSQISLSIPQAGTLTVQKEVCAILPFGLMLDEVRLIYATTQLLLKAEKDDEILYVFFAPQGMKSEYAFDASSYTDIGTYGNDIEFFDGTTIVHLMPGLDSLVTLEGYRTTNILTLTREQAEHCTKQMLWGRERLIISDADIVVNGDECTLHSLQTEAQMWVYPPVEGAIKTPYGKLVGRKDGIFTHFTITIPQKDVQPHIETISSTKALVTLPSDALEGLDNLLLHIDYVGDIGNAYVDGKLIADNFYNGTIWPIGLKQAAPTLPEILLLITPLRKNTGGSQYVPTGMAFRHDTGEEISLIRSVEAVPVYKTPLTRA